MNIVKAVTMSKANYNTIYTNGGQIAGVIFGDTLRIVKTSPNHYVKKYRGYGVSRDTLQEAQARGCKWLEIVSHTGETFRVRITDWLLAGIPDDLGAGRQLFMSCRSMRWYMDRDRVLDLDHDILQERRRSERQLKMWG